MYKRHPFPVFIVVLLVASLACGQFGGTPAPLDPNAQATSVQQTVVARQTEAVVNNPPTLTPTLVPPTLTFTPVFTSTPVLTATSSVPQVSVSLDTNCREGPGKTFENVGSLLVGESTDVIAGEPKGEFWYVRNPDNPEGYCWLWGEYATFTGNVYILPIITPPPPSTASFTVTYSAIDKCNDSWWIDFNIKNESDATFKSIEFTIEDATTNPVTAATTRTNGFINNDACKGPAREEVLGPNQTVVVSSPSLTYNPAGHNMFFRVKLCTEANQGGTCVTKESEFKP